MRPDPLYSPHWTIVETLPQDGGLRRYTRIEKNSLNALYMECGDPSLAGASDVRDFVRIGEWLRDIGVRTPQIYELFEEANAAIIEDFGAVSVKQAIVKSGGAAAMGYYKGAAEILKLMQNVPISELPQGLPHFEQSFMRKARQRFIDWYVPVLRQRANDSALVEEYHALWDGIEQRIGAAEEGFMHVDFHVENMMVLGGQSSGHPSVIGVDSIGVIDFQEGMIGPKAYDWSNLLEDMRADVPPDIRAALLDGQSREFLARYRVLGTQFHCRLLGQIMRWALAENKTQYMQYYPRLVGYVEAALADPVLAEFKAFLERERIAICDLSKMNWAESRKFIAQNAI
ncbi:MAG: aminoglycoside phosphotransferase family protein [Alphaproteobacteria bacterium]